MTALAAPGLAPCPGSADARILSGAATSVTIVAADRRRAMVVVADR